jgi:hypothetical protein
MSDFIKQGDRVIFQYNGTVRAGIAESYKANRHGQLVLTIKDDTRKNDKGEPAFRSFHRDKCEGLVNLSKV